jgi:hypothetical protein
MDHYDKKVASIHALRGPILHDSSRGHDHDQCPKREGTQLPQFPFFDSLFLHSRVISATVRTKFAG